MRTKGSGSGKSVEKGRRSQNVRRRRKYRDSGPKPTAIPWCSYRRRNHRKVPRITRHAVPVPQTKKTPITTIGKTSTRTKPKGLSASHKGGHRKKSNILTSKYRANSKRANTRIGDGNKPNLSRFANQMAAVPALITNQLWN